MGYAGQWDWLVSQLGTLYGWESLHSGKRESWENISSRGK